MSLDCLFVDKQIGRCWLDAIEVAQRSSLVQPEHDAADGAHKM